MEGDKGDKGDKGDAGDKGATGDKGDKGEDGSDATGAYIKQGSFEGAITGIRRDGTAINETFQYEYRPVEPETFQDDNIYFERHPLATENEACEIQIKKSGETIIANGFWLDFEKELDATTLLSLGLQA